MASSVSGRIELWASALDGIRDFRFTGMGMNGFRKVMPVLYPRPAAAIDVDVSHAHNHLLQEALDLGVPGLIAYSAPWIVVAGMLVRTYRDSSDVLFRRVAIGLGLGLVGHFVFSLTDAIPLGAKAGVLFWLTVSLATSLFLVSPAGARRPGK